MERLRLLDALAIIRAIQESARLLVPEVFPDVNDPAALYRWCHAVLLACARAARITPTKIDDAIVTWLLANPFASEESFRVYHQFFKLIIEAVLAGKAESEAAAAVAAAVPPQQLENLIPATSPLAQGSPIETLILLVRLMRLILDLFGPTATQQAIMEGRR
mgnify:CR=1 FL=1